MLRALFGAASGMAAQQVNIDTIANNIANVNTPGFKKARTDFKELIYAEIQPPDGAGTTTGIMVGQGTRLGNVLRVPDQGTLQATENPFDLAITGSGFFRVERDGRVAYTRDGSFRLDGQGSLVTTNGDFVVGTKGRITIPEGQTDVKVSPAGEVFYIEGNGARVVVDRILLALFPAPAGLEALGQNRWAETGASGRPAVANPGEGGAGQTVMGHLEGSNVNVLDEMVSLMMAQRAYQLNLKTVQSADEMMSMANGIFRG